MSIFPQQHWPDLGRSRLDRWLGRNGGLQLVMVIVPVILLLAILVVSWTPLSRNLGLPFGYYRDYSRILYEIGKIDRVAVTKVRLHEDVTLEDFSVTVDIDGRTVHLDFQPESETMKQMLKKLDQIR